MGSGDDDYLAREARARKAIDRQLLAAGWVVQSQSALNLSASQGVAVREYTLEKPHGRVDYLLFVDGKPAGVIEAKPEGTTLTEVEHQSGRSVSGLPSWMRPLVYPLPFIYESTGTETRFTNGTTRRRAAARVDPVRRRRRPWLARLRPTRTPHPRLRPAADGHPLPGGNLLPPLAGPRPARPAPPADRLTRPGRPVDEVAAEG